MNQLLLLTTNLVKSGRALMRGGTRGVLRFFTTVEGAWHNGYDNIGVWITQVVSASSNKS
jgi:hypothetical protein